MMSDAELIATSMRLKDDGNARFKLNECKAAEGHYRDALAHLETVKNDNNELRELKKTVLQNMSVMMNKTGDFNLGPHGRCQRKVQAVSRSTE